MENHKCKACGRVGCWTEVNRESDDSGNYIIWGCKCGEEYVEVVA